MSSHRAGRPAETTALDEAETLQDLAALPGNHLEALKGDRQGQPLNINVNQLAKSLAVDAARLNEIVRGRRGITADTALRLARYLGTTPEFWLKLQVHYELRVARQTELKDIERAVRPRSEAA
jgi:antitoxin HigA-1